MKNKFYLFATSLAFILTGCNDSKTIISVDPEDNYAKVIEYMPAPGQFINDNMTCNTMGEAVAWAQSRIDAAVKDGEKTYVSLGAFGGYLTVKLKMPVINRQGYDFGIMGNAYDGNSEPGIVWVSQDTNGNGQPDDIWYELKGSDFNTTKREYWVEYTRPAEAGDIHWEDSEGDTGVVKYNQGFHSQMYYPAWQKDAKYRLEGSLLQPKTELVDGVWKNRSYGWGYVDNLGEDTEFKTLGNGSKIYLYNKFDISDAVDKNGNQVTIEKIDFIKIQSAVQNNVDILGETSTEVLGFAFF